MKLRSLIVLAWLCAPLLAVGQGSVLSFEDFSKQVLQHHPLAVKARLQPVAGAAAVQQARGAYDPKVGGNLSQKYFNDTEYYSLLDAGLKVPTWFGVEVQGGYEQNRGQYLNPEANTPSTGLWYAGLSVPLGQGLFIDQRRAALSQAKLFEQSTLAAQQQMLNELLYNAGSAWWNWFAAYNEVRIYTDAREAAQLRFDAVKQAAALGDRPNIDTLEAGIQLQNRELALQQAQLTETNARAALSVFIWQNGQTPMEISAETRPPAIPFDAATPASQRVYLQLDSLMQQHPQLQQYRLKADQLAVEKRLKQEQLKPTVNLKYNALSSQDSGGEQLNYSPNNYKWGLEVAMPLFLRKERAAVRLADVKLAETELDITAKQQALTFKVQASYNEWNATAQQVALYNRTVTDYAGLLRGERQKFDAGESSLFLVNRRELGYISAQLKLLELLTKNRKAELATQFALGTLSTNL